MLEVNTGIQMGMHKTREGSQMGIKQTEKRPNKRFYFLFYLLLKFAGWESVKLLR